MKEDDLSSEGSLNKNSFDNKDLTNKQENNEDNQINEKVKNENEDIIEINIDEKKSLSTTKFILVLVLLPLGGLISTISFKIQQKSISLNILFQSHHFFPVLEIFLGKLLCLLIYYIKKFFSTENNNDEVKQKPKTKYFIILAILDILSNIIIIFNVLLINNSSPFKFLFIIIILSQIISIKLLKTEYFRHHFLAVVLSFAGLLMGEIKGIQIENNSGGYIALGIILAIGAQVSQSTHYILEEKLLKEYNYSTLKTIGLEGFWGFLIYSIILIIFQFISCENWDTTIKEAICSNDSNVYSTFKIENTIFALNQIKDNSRIFCSILIILIGVILNNIALLSIFKYRSVILALMFIGIINYIFLFIFVSLASNAQYNFSGIEFHWIQIVGFILQILALLIYSQILVIPFCGLGKMKDMDTKKAENKKSLLNIGLENEIEEK